jgi:hypothetical protein
MRSRQGGGGVVRADVQDFGQQDRALVETFGHAHDLDAGLFVAGHDGALDRRRAAPARQQRAVQVEAAQTRRLQHLGLQNLAVGDDAGGVDVQALEVSMASGGLHRGGGEDRQAHGLGEGVDRGRGQLLAAPARLGRLGIDGHDLMAAGDDLGQRRHGEVGGTHEGEAHPRALPYAGASDKARGLRAGCDRLDAMSAFDPSQTFGVPLCG